MRLKKKKKTPGEYTSQLMEGMCVMSLRESTVVTQEFKLTEITVSQLSVNYFTHTHIHTKCAKKDGVAMQSSECTLHCAPTL